MKLRSLVFSIIVAFVAAVLTSYASHRESRVILKYRFAQEDSVKSDLEDTIRNFNRLLATFYDTGGDTLSLNEFPATNLVKRRAFQDIDDWKNKGKWVIHDLQKDEILEVGIIAPGRAFVVDRELWQLWLRDIESAEKSDVKLNPVKVRYYLGIERGRWTVVEYEVYGLDDEMPELASDEGGVI